MSKFLVGIIFTLLAVPAGFYTYSHFGYIDIRADQQPSLLERRVAMGAMDASAERYAPRLHNPIEPTEANLIDGVKLYKSNCALCHGSPLNPAADLGAATYPRAPQFLKHAPDMPEHQNFFLTKHGVRWTAMPAWDKIMTDVEIWKVVAFLSHLEKLPPAVDAEWKKPGTP